MRESENFDAPRSAQVTNTSVMKNGSIRDGLWAPWFSAYLWLTRC